LRAINCPIPVPSCREKTPARNPASGHRRGKDQRGVLAAAWIALFGEVQYDAAHRLDLEILAGRLGWRVALVTLIFEPLPLGSMTMFQGSEIGLLFNTSFCSAAIRPTMG
jgi:hypothetical protein